MADHVAINRDFWDGIAEDWVAAGERLWALAEPVWGNWNVSTLDVLPEDMTGLAAVELGCGTGYVSGWMARRGAEVTALDVSPRQLSTARRLSAAHRANITFLERNAEATGLADGLFDFAISEYGAAIWCEPHVWLREAWRILKPGGRLVFLGNHPMVFTATPLSGADAEFVLHRSYRDLGRLDWTEVEIDPGGVEFNMSLSNWMRLFRTIGFAVEDYEEVYAPPDAEGSRGAVPAEWAKIYPVEQVWFLRKT